MVTISHWLGQRQLGKPRIGMPQSTSWRNGRQSKRLVLLREIDAGPAKWQADKTVIAWLESL